MASPTGRPARAAPRRPGAGSASPGRRPAGRGPPRRPRLAVGDSCRGAAQSTAGPSTSRRGPAERTAAGAHRPQPEVDGLGEAALVGHRARAPARRGAGRPRRGSSPRPRTTSREPGPVGQAGAHAGPRRDPGDGRHDHDQQPVAPRHHLVDQRVAPPRQVDAPRCRGRAGPPTAPRGPRTACERAAAARRTRSAPRGRRGAAAPRAATARSSRPVVWHSASQRTPSRSSRPSTRSTPGPERVEVDHHAGPAGAATWPSAQANVVAPAPPEPPTTPTRTPRRGRPSPRSVSSSTSQLAPTRQLDDALGADGERVAEQPGRHGAQRTTWTPARRGGAQLGERGGEVGADQHQRRGRPRAQRARAVGRPRA